MARMIVIYKTPIDKDAFDRHYFDVHIPLAKKLPGLIKYDISKSPIMSTTGNDEAYLIGTLHFDSLDDIKKAFASPQGKACAADRRILVEDEKNIQIYLFETTAV